MNDKEKVAKWMMEQGYATGHGDTIEDLLKELEWQVAERERKWVGLTKRDLSGYSPELKTILEYIEAILKRKNT